MKNEPPHDSEEDADPLLKLAIFLLVIVMLLLLAHKFAPLIHS